MKDVKERATAPLAVRSSSAPVLPTSENPGGSISSSIQKTLGAGLAPNPATKIESPLSSRVVNFRYRTLPRLETFSAFQTLGLTVAVDVTARTLFLRGPFDLVKEVGDMLEDTDKMPGSCSMRGWVVWIADSDAQGWEFTAELSAALGLDSDQWAASAGSGEVLLSAGVEQISGALRLISQDSRVTVVQEPHVRLTDLVESRIESLEELPIPETTLSNGIASESISYKRVGLELIVLPTFLPGNRVRLSVVQNGGVVGRTVEIKGAEIPVLQTQKVASDIELAIGQSLCLGGVRSSRTKKAKSWFARNSEIESGTLYVVVAVYHDEPKARVVTPPEWTAEMQAVIQDTDGLPWLTDGEVLPPKSAK